MFINTRDKSFESSNFHQIIANLSAENRHLSSQLEYSDAKSTSLTSQNKNLSIENQLLREQVKLLKAKRFGKSSEKLQSHDGQLEFWKEENSTEVQELESSPTDQNESKDEKRKPKRKKLPAHLPRESIALPPDPKCPDCGGEEFRTISEDTSETLEYVEALFKVIQYIRPRCVCTGCDKIVQAYPASKAIDKGLAGPGLLAHTLVQKYCNHLPIYRQHEIYAREGIEIPKSTMVNWVSQSAELLKPLIVELDKEIFSSRELHGDDTPIKVLSKSPKKTKTGRLWVYARDGRNYGSKIPPAVRYFYSPDRKGARPKEHLKDFKGILHADAYSGYDHLYPSKDNPTSEIIESACWAHTRRKFYEITVANNKANIAIEILGQISKLYKVEKKIRGLPPDKRLDHRQKESKILVDQLFKAIKSYLKDLPSKSATSKAINYALNNENALKRFLDDGRIEIDNNTAERALRPIAVGRKNWLFAGSDKGGETAAAIFSLIQTAKINGINPHSYLKKVLETINDHNSTKLHELLPWNINL